MKKSICLLALLLAGFTGTFAQDLTPKAVFFNYDFQTALISNLQVEVENPASFSVLDDYRIQVFVDGIGSVSCLGADYVTDWFNDGDVPANGSNTYTLPNIDLDNLDNTCGLPTGTYHLRVVVDVDNDVSEDNENNNEVSFTSDNFMFESLVSVDPGVLADIVLYPNPAQERFYIQRGEFSGDLQVEVVGLDGRTLAVQTMEAHELKKEINVVDYPAGIYLVNIQGESHRRSQKMVVR